MTANQVKELRELVRLKLERKSRQLIEPVPAPRYDEIYFKGSTWLDRQ